MKQGSLVALGLAGITIAIVLLAAGHPAPQESHEPPRAYAARTAEDVAINDTLAPPTSTAQPAADEHQQDVVRIV